MSLTNKIDFAVVFSVKNANPNGDPLNGNRPRVTFDGFGELSDVCIKRKIRDRLMDSGKDIFVQSDDRRNDDYRSLRQRAEASIKKGLKEDEIRKLACEKWFDVRAFGQLFAFAAKKGKAKSGGETGDDKGVSIGIRGPVSVHPAFSLERVNVTSTQITKSVSGEGDGKKRASDTMGMKHRIDQGVYAFFGSMNPQLALKTGFSDEDAEAIRNVLPKLFENDASSARPEGSMQVLKVIWWQHDCPAGQVSSARVHRSLRVQIVEADLVLAFDDVGGPQPDVQDGF